MALIEFKNKPDKSTAINANNLNFNFEEVMNLIYPINSIIIKADNEDYSDWLGFEWERTLVGKVAVGINSDDTDFDTINKTGGEKEHILTINEMPNHNHPQSLNGGSSANSSKAAYDWSIPTNRYEYSGSDLSISVGGNQPHNNLQPYQVVAFWKRIA